MANGGRPQSDATEKVLLGIACVVTVVWAIATMVQVVAPSHPVPGYANLVMMSVATFFFGGAIFQGRKRVPPHSNGRSVYDRALEEGRRQLEGKKRER